MGRHRYDRALVFFALGILGASFFPHSVQAETVLLDFTSPSCGWCQKLNPILHQLEQEGYPVHKVDVSEDQTLARQYKVSGLPCLILLRDGEVVDRVEGYRERNEIVRMYERAGYSPNDGSENQVVRGQSPGRRSGRSTFANSEEPQSIALPDQPNPAAAQVMASAPMGQVPLAQRLIESSVRIKVVDPTGQSYGTGTIISAVEGRAIVVTCGHLFREGGKEGPVTVDLFKMTPEGPQVLQSFPAKVLSYDMKTEVGLLEFQPSFLVRHATLGSEETRVSRGESVSSVGCDHGNNPTHWDSRVTTLNRYSGPENIETTGTPVVGRSGGGLFNADGELIGVCFAADERGNEGLYSALSSVYQELRKAQVQLAPPEATENIAATMPAAAVPAERIPAYENLAPNVLPVTNVSATSPGLPSNGLPPTPAGAMNGITSTERATLEELARRGAESEVICIIRPKDPNGKSEVITIHGASPAFVAQLTNAAGATSQPQVTSHSVANQPLQPMDPNEPTIIRGQGPTTFRKEVRKTTPTSSREIKLNWSSAP